MTEPEKPDLPPTTPPAMPAPASQESAPTPLAPASQESAPTPLAPTPLAPTPPAAPPPGAPVAIPRPANVPRSRVILPARLVPRDRPMGAEKPIEGDRPVTAEGPAAVPIARPTPPAPRAPAPPELPPVPPPTPPSLEHEQTYGGLGRKRVHDIDAEIEREMEEALAGMSAKDILGEPSQRGPKAPAAQPGGALKGKVVRVHSPDVFVDVPGGRSQGVLPLLQFPDGVPAPGTEVEVTIQGYDRANGLLLLNRKGQAQEVDWSTVSVGAIVEALVTGTNKGGLSVTVNHIRGFMPISQIDLYRVDNPDQFLNQRLKCEVVEVKPDEHNLVVSRRALLEREREENREKLWKELAEGQVRSGVVRSVRDFGAFVDLGGVDGLLHVSEMSWSRVSDPNQVVQPGQTIRVVVLKIDPDTRKVGLGLKQLMASPWDDIQTRYIPGHRVKGQVTRVMDFGAFVELEPAVEGLIHVSELSPQRVRRVQDIVKPGDPVEVVVLNVDPGQRRISLSLKAALAKAAEAAAEAAEEPEEPTAPAKPPRPRTTPLRGGIGQKLEIPPLKQPPQD